MGNVDDATRTMRISIKQGDAEISELASYYLALGGRNPLPE